MKVLILSCNTGGGHNGAARAIAEEFESRGIECFVENALSFAVKPEEDIIVDGYAFAFNRLPGVWKAGYTYAEEHSAYPMYLNFAKYATPLKRYIEHGGYDIVICTHIFAAHMMTRVRRKYALPVRQYFVCTDYSCSPGYELPEVDRLFIPRELTNEFLFHGVPASRLFEVGIPVRTACYEPVSKEFAREALHAEMAIAPDCRMVAAAPGCLEAPDIKRLVSALPEDLSDTVFLIITGKENVNFRRQISRMANPRVKALSYTTHMDLWMKAADLLITKPGGLTSTEAMSCGVPIILMDVKPGLETHNRDFYVSRGCASAATGLPALYAEVVRLLRDEGARERMVARQRANFSTRAVVELVDEVLRPTGEPAAAPVPAGEESAPSSSAE